MSRPERALNPDHGSAARFAAALRELRDSAGRPGYRELARRAHYSATTLAAAASGRRLPSLPVTLAYVTACGGDPRCWTRRWEEAAAAQAETAPAVATRPPYRGGAAYGPEDAPWFFGREAALDGLRGHLREDRLVALIGPSGCGKSSLLRAGLVAAARAERPAGHVVAFTPGVRPCDELAVALAEALDAPPATLRDDVRAAPDRLHLAARRLDGGLLLVVDQFEEVFTRCADQAERDDFVAALLAATGAENSRTRVVLGIRADAWEHCATLPGRRLRLGPMTAAELREAITGPARHAGLMVEGGLVTTVAAAAAGQPGALPLVSQALHEAWRRRRGGAVTLAGFQDGGGLDGAVTRAAEQLWAGLGTEDREHAFDLLARLVEIDVDGTPVRRRAPRAELAPSGAASHAILERLARARLLTIGADDVELAHEALARSWPRWRARLDARRDDLRLYRRIADAARAWEADGRPSCGLLRGGRLVEARRFEARGTVRLDAVERGFLDAATASADRETAAARRRRACTVTAAGAALVAIVVLVVSAMSQARRAEHQRDLARSRQLAASARTELGWDGQLALLLAVRAYRTAGTAEAEAALRQAVWDAGLLGGRTLPGAGPGPVRTLTASPDGRWLAGGGEDTLTLWPVAGGEPVALPGTTGTVTAVAFSPDSARLAATTTAGVVVWRLADRSATVFGTASAAAFGPDGGLLLGERGGPLRHLAPGTSAGGAVRAGHDGAVTSVAVSPDGTRAVSGGADGTVRVHDLAGRTPVVVIGVRGGPVRGVAFGPAGAGVTGVGGDGTLRRWTPAGTPVAVHTGPDSAATLWFAPDGTRIISRAADGTVALRELTRPDQPLVIAAPRTGVGAAAYLPGGETVATAHDDGTVRLRHCPVCDPAAETLALAEAGISRPPTPDERRRYGI